MEIEISKDILNNIEKASKELGISKKEVIARALGLYLKNLREYVKLQEEIEAWEEAGIEDSDAFFKQHNL